MSENFRRAAIDSSRQVIVKAGTRLLIDRQSIANLVAGVAALRKSGRQVLLVSSGAVGMGMEVLGLDRRPKQLFHPCRAIQRRYYSPTLRVSQYLRRLLLHRK